MPSTTVQARISTFESLAGPDSSSKNGREKSAADILETPLSPTTAASLQPVAAFTTRPSPSPSPPNLGRKTSLIDLTDWIIDDAPSPPRPFSNGLPDSTRGSATVIRNGGPLISLESPPRPKPKPKPATLSVAAKPPQLPPRKSSYTSLKSVASSSSYKSSPPPPPSAFLYPPRRADTLTIDHPYNYPPLSIEFDPNSRNSPSHGPSSSISSFHSVSLSSDTDPSTPGSVANFIATFPIDQEHGSPPANGQRRDADSISLSESYEEVSTSSLASPATERLINLDWERAISGRKRIPPKLPERPSSTRASIKSPPPPSHPVSRAASSSYSTPSSPIIGPSSNTNTPPTSYTPRRVAPPPPSRSSDRSSIQSTATTQSFSSSSQSHQSRTANPPPLGVSLKTKRPTPVPLTARKRYEVVFNQNILQRRRAEKRKQEEKPALLNPNEARGRRAAGWRGLSVDLITADGAPPQPQRDDKVDEVVGNDEKLEGAIVKLIWKRSGLRAAQLAEIWNECDLTGQGALSLEAFVKGMWRIDEELRRTQAQAIKSATNLGSYRSQSLRQKPRDILR